ncbi:unnamed protein product [Protopolystoma xenopodis]|uniref:Uncharacterized protein n=1 Tax=Protopolystoma xenopodis TaxID=117903 RepID=A0A448XEE3_9PLAT|nr:unnamed protein product [Protopolystoma xenopodis]
MRRVSTSRRRRSILVSPTERCVMPCASGISLFCQARPSCRHIANAADRHKQTHGHQRVQITLYPLRSNRPAERIGSGITFHSATESTESASFQLWPHVNQTVVMGDGKAHLEASHHTQPKSRPATMASSGAFVWPCDFWASGVVAGRAKPRRGGAARGPKGPSTSRLACSAHKKPARLSAHLSRRFAALSSLIALRPRMSASASKRWLSACRHSHVSILVFVCQSGGRADNPFVHNRLSRLSDGSKHSDSDRFDLCSLVHAGAVHEQMIARPGKCLSCWGKWEYHFVS